MKFTFLVGIMQDRRVTVRAKDKEEAVRRACTALDLRAERAGKEAPVAWTLTLKEAAE